MKSSRVLNSNRAVTGWRVLSGFLIALSAISCLSGCSDASGQAGKAQPKTRTAVPVTIAQAVQKTVPVQITGIGNVQAYTTVSVKAKVEGELVGVHFKEGQELRKGDLLFTIDPRAYEAKLKQIEANLAKDRAQLENSKKQTLRYASVVKKGYVSAEQYDQIATTTVALEATVKADEAAVDSAKLDLAFCTIRTPVTGTVGEVRVHQGNLLKANDNDRPLVVINQIKPIYVSFAIPEQNLREVVRYMAGRKLEVVAEIPGESKGRAKGELTFIDNSVNSSTGTIQLKATFANEDRALWPGQFVSVVLTLTSQDGAVTVPSQAVQTGQQGQYIYVVRDDSTVEYRPVKTSRIINGDTVIAEGLKAGETVVTDGQLRLGPDAPIKVVESSEDKQ